MIGTRFMNRSVIVQRATLGSRDERGIAAQTWADYLILPASSQPLTVREVEQLSQSGPVSATHRIYLAGSPDINESDRIVDGPATFQIDGIADPAGAGHHLEILAHSVTA